MDYYLARPVPSFKYKKFTICIYLVLFLAPNSFGFESNDNSKITANLEVIGALTAGSFQAYSDSKITANLEVTGAFKAGSVDSSSSGIVTTIADSSQITIPTTGAVKAYVDAQVAGSSGGYPTEFLPFSDESFNQGICKEYSEGKSGDDWRLPTLNEMLNSGFDTPRYVWTTDVGFEKDHYIAVNVVSGSVDSFDRTSLGSGDGYDLNHICLR